MAADPTATADPRPPFKYARELTSLALAPVAVWTVGWAPGYLFDGAVAIVAVLALYEFLLLGRRKGYHLPFAVCVAVMLFIIAAFVLDTISVELGMFATLLIIPAYYVLRGPSVEESLPSSAIAVLGTMYVGMLAGSLIRLRNDFPVGPKLVYFLLLVVWLGDAGAYYTGKRFGRHKLSPRISPKKTVEGLAGGIITSIVTALVIHFTFFHEIQLLHTIVLGVILSAAGVVGDLAESMWKRSADVKDSGTLIRGHGGFLDRFDSIFFTAPILYVYWALAQGVKTLNIIQG